MKQKKAIFVAFLIVAFFCMASPATAENASLATHDTLRPPTTRGPEITVPTVSVNAQETADVAVAITHFTIPGFHAAADEYGLRRVPGGNINATYFVTDNATGEVVVLQRVNDQIFDISAIDNNTKGIMAAQEATPEEEYPKGWQDARFYPVADTPETTYIYYDEQGRPWRAMEYIDARVFSSFQTVEQELGEKAVLDAAFSMGFALAFFNYRLDRYWPADLAILSPLPNFHNTAYHYEYLRGNIEGRSQVRSLSRDPDNTVTPDLDFRARYNGEIEALWNDVQAHGVIIKTAMEHFKSRKAYNDPKITNLFFAMVDEMLTCIGIGDLDTVQEDPYNEFVDIGDAGRSAGNVTGEEPQSLLAVRVNKEVIYALINGYVVGTRRYYGEDSEEARRAEEFGLIAVRVIFLELCMRFFADSLCENPYFGLKTGEELEVMGFDWRSPETLNGDLTKLNLYRAQVLMTALKQLEQLIAEDQARESAGTQSEDAEPSADRSS